MSLFTEREREEIRPRSRLSIREWATRRLRITEGPLVGTHNTSTAWNPATFPLQSTVMEAIGDRRWSKVWLCTGPQMFGKTESAALPALLHAIEHRQVSALYVASRLPLALTQWRKKMLPAMLADSGMRALIPEDRDLIGDKNERRFLNGQSLHCAGSESVGAISGFTAPVVVCDDIQAYVAALPGFGHPVDVAFARSGAFPEDLRTLIGCGTAGLVDDYLWRALMGSALFMPFVPCPQCGTYQLLEWDRLRFPDDAIAAVGETWLQCAGGAETETRCPCRITFDDLPAMLARHLWVSCPPGEDWICRPPAAGTTIDPTEASIYPATRRSTAEAGFWANGLYWPLGLTWGEHAADWLACRGDPDREKDHQQRVRVVAWREPDPDENALSVEDLAEHAGAEHKHLQVPAWCDVLTLTADVHDRFLYLIVRGWKKADGTSALIDAGTVGVHGPKKGEVLTADQQKARIGHAIRLALEDLWSMENKGWVRAGGEVMRAALVLIDGGYRPDAVGQFCRARNAGLPVRKWEMVEGSRSSSPLAVWPRQLRRNQRGHAWREIGTAEAKHLLRELLAIPRGQPGYWSTYADHPLEAYHRHLCSEHWVERRTPSGVRMAWEKRPGSGPNHWLDCEVYQVAAAIACGVRLGPPAGQSSAAGGQRSADSPPDKPPATNWFNQRRKR